MTARCTGKLRTRLTERMTGAGGRETRPHHDRSVRSGGGCDTGSLASGHIVFMQHGVEEYVEKLDYFTTPSWLQGGDSRRYAGYRRGGPIAVVTDLLRAQVRRGVARDVPR